MWKRVYASYTPDWNIGVTKDMGYGVVGLLCSDTNTGGSCNSSTGGTNYCCWGKRMDTAGHHYRDESKGQLVMNFKKPSEPSPVFL